MSSSSTIRGRREARASKRRRTAGNRTATLSGSARSPIAVAISGETCCPSWSSTSNRCSPRHPRNPAASITASRTGRKATPSPGAGQRWVMALASPPIEDTNSLARRDFPIPASPSTVSRQTVPERTTRRNAERNRVSSPWRPNIGASSARDMAGAWATTSRICQPEVSPGAPWRGFMITAPRSSCRAAGPTTIWSSGAACCNRVAALTTAPQRYRGARPRALRPRCRPLRCPPATGR